MDVEDGLYRGVYVVESGLREIGYFYGVHTSFEGHDCSFILSRDSVRVEIGEESLGIYCCRRNDQAKFGPFSTYSVVEESSAWVPLNCDVSDTYFFNNPRRRSV